MRYTPLPLKLHNRAVEIGQKMPKTAALLRDAASELIDERGRAKDWWREFVKTQAECCETCGDDARALRDSFMRQVFMPEGE